MNPVMVIFLHKETLKPCGGYVQRNVFNIQAGSRLGDLLLGKIGAKQLDWKRKSFLFQKLQQVDCYGIHFFPSRAARYPDSYWFPARLVFYKTWEYRLFQ